MADNINEQEKNTVPVIAENEIKELSGEHQRHHHHRHHRRKRSLKSRIKYFFKRKKTQKFIILAVILIVIGLVVFSAYYYDRESNKPNNNTLAASGDDNSYADKESLRLYSFGVLADIHLQYETGTADFERALSYLKNKVDFTCVAGDLVSFASKENMEEYRAYVDLYSGDMSVYECAGNHDTYPELGVAGTLDENMWKTYTDDPMYYSFNKGNDVFIMLGMNSEHPEKLFPQGSLKWLKDTLEANKNKRCFVFQHAPELTDKTADPSESWSDIMEGSQGKEFVSIIKQYPNVVWFHGHTHTTLGVKQNPVSHLDYRSVHVPSLTAPRFYDVDNQALSDYYYDGYGNKIWGSSLAEGYIIDVYANKIVIRGINFAAGENANEVQAFADEIYVLDTCLRLIEN